MTELATLESEVKSKVGTYLRLFAAHERLVIVLIVAVLSWHFYTRAIDVWLAHDQRQSTAVAQIVQVDDTKVKQLESQLAQLQSEISKQNAQLAGAIQTRDAVTKKQQIADAQQTPQEQLARLKSLLGVGDQDLQSSPIEGSVVFDATAVTTTEQDLDELGTLQQDNTDLRTELNNDTKIISVQNDTLAQEQKELTDEKTSHQDDVKTLKSENKRQFNRGLKWGLILGAVGGEVIRVVITHGL